MVLAWTVIAAPFAIFGSFGSRPEWGEFVVAILVVSGIMLALFLPLVLLSFFQPFYRARFFSLLKLPQPDLSGEGGTPPRMPDEYQIRGNNDCDGDGKVSRRQAASEDRPPSRLARCVPRLRDRGFVIQLRLPEWYLLPS